MTLCKRYNALRTLLWALVLLAVCPAAFAAGRDYTVTAPDGVVLAVHEAGDPDGVPVIFVHGLLGSRLNWNGPFQAPAFQHYRLIAYDLRGHGLSGKPTDAAAYTDGRRWADDLATVIASTHARKPILVGWSLGAAVISNYLAAHGDKGIAGAVYVDGVIELKPDQILAHLEVYRDMTASDLKTHLDGERAFLRLCFSRQPDADTFFLLLANAALASWDMQRAVPSMTIDAAKGIGNARVPLLLIYGAQDALVDSQTSIAKAKSFNPRIQSKSYAESGHAPFIDESDRFNRYLLTFIRAVVPH